MSNIIIGSLKVVYICDGVSVDSRVDYLSFFHLVNVFLWYSAFTRGKGFWMKLGIEFIETI